MTNEIRKKLNKLGFSEREAAVYIALTQLGESSAAKIAKKCELPRTTTISILEKLEAENYISIQKYRGRHVYWIESPNMIKSALMEKVEMAEGLNILLADLYRSEATFPFGKIFDTKSGIKSFIEKLMLHAEKGETIYTIDNPKSGNYKKILSEEFYFHMLAMKQKKGAITKTLVPHGTAGDIDKEKVKRQHIEIRQMPNGIAFASSMWIIKDMLILFSGKYPFVVAVNHKIITASFKSIFDYLWKISR